MTWGEISSLSRWVSSWRSPASSWFCERTTVLTLGRRLAARPVCSRWLREGAPAQRNSPVEKAEVSERAKAKADTKLTPPDGLPVHSFTTLFADLGTLTLHHASIPGLPDNRFLLASEPTELQAKAFELLGMDPDRDAYISVTA